MISYLENSKGYTQNKNLLELIKLSKIAGYKIIIQKPILFLYTSNKQSENEIRKIILSSKIKHLGIRLTKEMQGLYTESSKTSLREI